MFTRREFGKMALAGLPAAALAGRPEGIFGAFAQPKPNSLIEGVQIGVITYSYRSLPDQSAEATLKYIVDSGVSAIELMGGPVESFAGAPVAAAGGGGGRGRAGGPSAGPATAAPAQAPTPAGSARSTRPRPPRSACRRPWSASPRSRRRARAGKGPRTPSVRCRS